MQAASNKRPSTVCRGCNLMDVFIPGEVFGDTNSKIKMIVNCFENCICRCIITAFHSSFFSESHNKARIR